jgi:pullulanase
VIPAAAEDGVTIKLHYNRPDGNYTDWSVWFWDYGKDGKDIPFADENGEKVATYNVAAGVEKVGFIVKLPNWAAKDVAEDQFIEIGSVLSGTVHVYVESGVKGFELKYGDDIVTGIKLTNAEYDGRLTVTVTMTDMLITDYTNAFTLKCGDQVIALESVTNFNQKYYKLKLTEELDLMSTYTLIYDNKEYNVVMPDIFSTEKFEEAYTYTGSDLGAVWSADKTAFRLWAPTATSAKVNLYVSGVDGTDDLIEQLEMTADVNGTWIAEKEGDLNGTFYTYTVEVAGAVNEAADPYAVAAGVNGKRSMVIDLDSTDPEGWEQDTDPNAGLNVTDMSSTSCISVTCPSTQAPVLRTRASTLA